MFQISNEKLSVSLSAKGAELQSLYLKETGIEYMWNADPAFWSKKSPVLFPIVGGLQNNTYHFKGHDYQLPRHGFAREKTFSVHQHSDTDIQFTLASDEETLLVYPFHFLFSVSYSLENTVLSVTYRVENTGTEPMYFSVGAHPAFAVPLLAQTKYTDHYLKFNHRENAGRWPLTKDGLIESSPIPLLVNTSNLPLNKELFYGDALVFKDLASTAISILNKKNKHGLTVSFPGFPYMGIWSFKNADFVCIEPWCGIADSTQSNGRLEDKEGINELAADEVFTRSWHVTLF